MSVSSDAPADPRQEVPWPDEPPEPPPPNAAHRGAPPQPPTARSTPETSLPIGRLRRADPVELWRSDALAAWLRDNLDEVGKLVGIKLTPAAESATSGTVAATDAAGAPVRVVVELGASSDETFGLLMRQIVASGAGTAIWVCAQARDEHLTSVKWLNREISGKVHVVTVEAVRIDDSVPAPIFRLALRATDAAEGTPAP